MSCTFERELLERFHDDECSEAEGRRVRTHLAGCESCRRLVESWKKVDDWSRVLLEEEPVDSFVETMEERIRDRLAIVAPPRATEASAAPSRWTGSLVLASLAFVAGSFAGRPLADEGRGWLSPSKQDRKPAAVEPRPRTKTDLLPAKTATPPCPQVSATVEFARQLLALERDVRHERHLLAEGLAPKARSSYLSGADRRVSSRKGRLSLAGTRSSTGNFFDRRGAYKAWLRRLPSKTMPEDFPASLDPDALQTLFYVNREKALRRLDEALGRLGALEEREAEARNAEDELPPLCLSRGKMERWMELQERFARILVRKREAIWPQGLDIHPLRPRRGDVVVASFTLPRDRAPGELLRLVDEDGKDLRPFGTAFSFRCPADRCTRSLRVETPGDSQETRNLDFWLLPRDDRAPSFDAFLRETQAMGKLLRRLRLPTPSLGADAPSHPRLRLEWIHPERKRSPLLLSAEIPPKWQVHLRFGSDAPSFGKEIASPIEGRGLEQLILPEGDTNEPVRVDGFSVSPEGRALWCSTLSR